MKDLTSIEESMINIYSAVTNISLVGGKHFKVRGATCYTIINDLTSVAKELPCMPTVDCTAVLRHVNTKLSKAYTYRPSRVNRALNWLKRNNHLYEGVKLVWSSAVIDWANNCECIDIPFIEVSDAEEFEIDEGQQEPSVPGDTPSSNPGICLLSKCIIRCLTHFYLCFTTFHTLPASSGQENQYLLEAPTTLVSLLENIRNSLVEPSQKCIHRTAYHEFVHEYYLPRCFSTLFHMGLYST